MTASQNRAQPGVDPSGVSPVSIRAWPGVDGVVGRDRGIDDGHPRRRADGLDAEAKYYRHRAVQEDRALGPGYYVDLLWGVASDRAAMAQWMMQSVHPAWCDPRYCRFTDVDVQHRSTPTLLTSCDDEWWFTLARADEWAHPERHGDTELLIDVHNTMLRAPDVQHLLRLMRSSRTPTGS